MDRAQAIRKVQKARALAGRAGTREEATQAAGVAYDLIHRYKLTEEELAPPAPKVVDIRSSGGRPAASGRRRVNAVPARVDPYETLIAAGEELGGRLITELLKRLAPDGRRRTG